MGVVSCGTTMLDQGVFQNIGAVTWDTTAKTSGFTAVSGNGYFCNTTSGAFTVTLPAGSAGDIFALADYAATWQTNNVTVTPNGSDKIGGANANVTLSTEGQSVTFIYADSTQGWLNTIDSTSNARGASFITATGGTITTSGNYKIHKFTGPGTFAVSATSACSANNIVSYMVVGGGGGGGASGAGGGGGGAGGFREYKGPADCYSASPLNGNPGGTAITVTATPYPITVGGGGSAGTFGGGYPGAPFTAATSGANSVFSTITSTGGGFGAGDPAPRNGTAGGSGGGGANTGGTGGAGNTPPVSPSQGFPGGNGGPNTGGTGSGGGGGSTQAGTNIAGGTPAKGGNGATTSITASPTAYGGGGGGGSHTGDDFGAGGTGGGGDAYSPGAPPTPTPSTAGTANTGGGGGAGTARGSTFMGDGAAGGSGIVVIRYKYQ